VGNSIIVEPVLGQNVTINSVGISGGGPTYSQTFNIPASTDTIATYLAALLNTNLKITASSNDSTITIVAIDTANPYSIIVGTNLNITSTSSPVLFLAQTYGPIPAPANSLTQIMTPISGWDSITNYQAGVTGRNIENDAEFRIRRLNSLRVQGSATVEAIRARLLQEVPNVTSVTIFENVTMTQSPMEVTFSIDFVSGN
ncbi:MAG: baseplate J/gp47 family protein, partial [Thermoplasmatales archaeon]